MRPHAAHRHAHMLGFNHNCGAAGIEVLVHRVDDLRRHVLLHLEPAGIDFDQSRQL